MNIVWVAFTFWKTIVTMVVYFNEDRYFVALHPGKKTSSLNKTICNMNKSCNCIYAYIKYYSIYKFIVKKIIFINLLSWKWNIEIFVNLTIETILSTKLFL